MNLRNPRTAPMLGLMVSASLIASLACFQIAAASDVHGAPLPLTLGTGSTVWLEGTSSLHEFESRTSTFSVHFQRDAAARDPMDVAGLDQLIRTSGVTGLDVDIPIAEMRSGKSGLDKNMQKSLKADQFPSIRFRLGRYAMTATSAADTAGLQAEGTLTVAGRERPATLNARAYRSAQGVWVEGTQSLLMTDFGIRPPTMMLGALKVGDRVTVHYRLLLVPVSAGAVQQSSRTN